MGVAITDHETVGNHVNALHKMKELKEKDPEKWKDYKLILGNEIYLCNRKQIEEEKNYTFPHFILIAKNLNGHHALRELSTTACCENSFMYVHMRTPTYYDDLVRVMKEYKGDVIASTACAGGSLPRNILKAYFANNDCPDLTDAKLWINKMKQIFGDENFFLELQPSIQEAQKIINKYLIQLSKETNTPYIITTDSHYLLKEDRPIHAAFIASQEADREVGDFYGTTYCMSEEEIHQYLDEFLGKDAVQKGIDNTMLVYNMSEEYTLDKPLDIPYIPDDNSEPDKALYEKYKEKIPLFEDFYNSKYDSDRHLIREITKKFEQRPEEFQNQKTYDAVEVCLDSIKKASDKQNTAWSGYMLQTGSIVNECWKAGSLIAASRGSGAGFILLYLLDIIQINCLREEVETFPWRSKASFLQ